MLLYQVLSAIDEWFSKPSPASAFCSNLPGQYLLAASNTHNSDCPPESSHKDVSEDCFFPATSSACSSLFFRNRPVLQRAS